MSAETDGDHLIDTMYVMQHDPNILFVMARSFVVVSFGLFDINYLQDGYPWNLIFDCNMGQTEILQNDYVMIIGTRDALDEVIRMSLTYEELYEFNTAPLQRLNPYSNTPPGSPRSEESRGMVTTLINQTRSSSMDPAWTEDERILARTVNQDLRRVLELDLQNLASSVTTRIQDLENILMNADTEPEQDSGVEE